MNHRGYLPIPSDMASSEKLLAFPVRGACMDPAVRDGDFAIVAADASWSDGDIVVVQADGMLYVKRAYRDGEQVRLRADAPGWPELVFPSSVVHVVGPVVLISRSVS